MTLKKLFHDVGKCEWKTLRYATYIYMYTYLLHEGTVSFLQKTVAVRARKHEG